MGENSLPSIKKYDIEMANGMKVRDKSIFVTGKTLKECEVVLRRLEKG